MLCIGDDDGVCGWMEVISDMYVVYVVFVELM